MEVFLGTSQRDEGSILIKTIYRDEDRLICHVWLIPYDGRLLDTSRSVNCIRPQNHPTPSTYRKAIDLIIKKWGGGAGRKKQEDAWRSITKCDWLECKRSLRGSINYSTLITLIESSHIAMWPRAVERDDFMTSSTDNTSMLLRVNTPMHTWGSEAWEIHKMFLPIFSSLREIDHLATPWLFFSEALSV